MKISNIVKLSSSEKVKSIINEWDIFHQKLYVHIPLFVSVLRYILIVSNDTADCIFLIEINNLLYNYICMYNFLFVFYFIDMKKNLVR